MISDWADKQNIVEGMKRLYNDDQFNNLLKQIATAIESLVKKEEQQNEVESAEVSILDINPKKRIIPKDAFVKFAMNHGISSGLYKIKNHDASFLVPIFRELENIYGVTRMKWWWHDSTFM